MTRKQKWSILIELVKKQELPKKKVRKFLTKKKQYDKINELLVKQSGRKEKEH